MAATRAYIEFKRRNLQSVKKQQQQQQQYKRAAKGNKGKTKSLI